MYLQNQYNNTTGFYVNIYLAKHSIVLTSYCEVYVFGENNFGQLGRGDRKPMLLPKLLTSLHKYLPAKPVLISASGFHSLISLTDGKIRKYIFVYLTAFSPSLCMHFVP